MFVRAYLRASTKEQDATRARSQLQEFAETKGLTIAATYTENESGASLARPELFRLLQDCHPGDILLVEQVDRAQPDWMAQLESTLREVRLAGAILTPPICDWPDLIDMLEANEVPIVRIAPGAPEKIGHVATGRLVLDGDVILPGDGSTINERRKLALNGQISVAVAIGSRGLIGQPQVRLQGIPVEEDREPFIDEALEAAATAARGKGRDRDRLREDIRLAVRRVATRWTGKKPIVDVLLIEA